MREGEGQFKKKIRVVKKIEFFSLTFFFFQSVKGVPYGEGVGGGALKVTKVSFVCASL